MPLDFLEFVLSFLYWHHLQSRVGIAVWAATVASFASVVSSILDGLAEFSDGKVEIMVLLGMLSFFIVEKLVNIAILWAVQKRGKLGSRLLKGSESHWEGASARTERPRSRIASGVSSSFALFTSRARASPRLRVRRNF